MRHFRFRLVALERENLDFEEERCVLQILRCLFIRHRWKRFLLGSCVSNPFDNWKNKAKRFRERSATKYHLFSKLCAENFLCVIDSAAIDVALQLNDQKSKEIEQH